MTSLLILLLFLWAEQLSSNIYKTHPRQTGISEWLLRLLQLQSVFSYQQEGQTTLSKPKKTPIGVIVSALCNMTIHVNTNAGNTEQHFWCVFPSAGEWWTFSSKHFASDQKWVLLFLFYFIFFLLFIRIIWLSARKPESKRECVLTHTSLDPWSACQTQVNWYWQFYWISRHPSPLRVGDTFIGSWAPSLKRSSYSQRIPNAERRRWWRTRPSLTASGGTLACSPNTTGILMEMKSSLAKLRWMHHPLLETQSTQNWARGRFLAFAGCQRT